jgi:peptidoglycan/xylan/chitin deacetylase (PgdA/CDA1 family)
MYFITPPRWLKWMYPGLTWEIPVEKDEKILYLTFDDGPHPIATPFVLEQLKKYNAKATFFCIGRNVADHRDVYQQVLDEGHTVGNHTYDHLNGWKTDDRKYVADVMKAAELIDSKLFRPPYGKITRFQSGVLRKKPQASDKQEAPIVSQQASETDRPVTGNDQRPPERVIRAGSTINEPRFNIIMWNVLSADWDTKIDGKKCFENVVLHAKPGSIIVFHDSAKAMDRMQFALPLVLEHYHQEGFRFEAIKNH